MKKTIIIILGVLLFTSCLKDEIPFQYSIRVQVTDYEGNRVEGADVTLKYLKDGKKDYPCIYREGYYEFIDLINAGEYQIWVHKQGNIYKDNFGDATLNENKVERVNIKLDKF